MGVSQQTRRLYWSGVTQMVAFPIYNVSPSIWKRQFVPSMEYSVLWLSRFRLFGGLLWRPIPLRMGRPWPRPRQGRVIDAS